MRISQKGVDLIKHYEGCKLKAYRDIVGVLTIGYGHTGGDVRDGQVITQDDAEALLRLDLERFERGVERVVKVPLTQNQFDALVSFSFNLGLGALKSSTLLKKVNAEDWEGVKKEFLKWDMAGGHHVNGLLIRRTAESFLFASQS